MIYGLVSIFATPYSDTTKQRSEFYVSSEASKPTSVRATILEAGNETAVGRLEEGPQEGQSVKVHLVNMKVEPGDKVLLGVSGSGEVSKYAATFWRIPGLVGLVLIFILVVFLVGGKRGLASLLGLFISVMIIVFGLIPAILQGVDAFIACVVAAFAIAMFAIITAHGWRWRTFVSMISIFTVLTITILLSLLGESIGYLTGIYDETSALLQIREVSIDLRGVLVGGIIIATLGVLDDVVTTQTATVEELHKANSSFSFWELFRRGQSVGNEHVASLVNTLALAYVGVSLPMILSIALNSGGQSMLLTINSEFIAQEIVRTLVSSIALVAAVPISTAVAAILVSRREQLFVILKRIRKNNRRTVGR